MQRDNVEDYTTVEVDNGRWRSQAKCRGEDTEIFFPTRAEYDPNITPGQRRRLQEKINLLDPNIQSNQISRARVMCVQCPVRKECLEFAVINFIVHGIYGGLTPKDRRGMTPESLKIGIPFSLFLKDLNRVRRMEKRLTVPLAHDVATVLNMTINAAENMLRRSDNRNTLV
jgi:WhiB family redox-sensing transcriptional regulator